MRERRSRPILGNTAKLLTALVLFIIAALAGPDKYLSSGALVDAAYAAVIVALSIAYAAADGGRMRGALFDILFVASLILFSTSTFLYLATGQFTAYWLGWAENAFAYSCIFLILMLLLNIAVFVDDRVVRIAVSVAVIAIVLVFYLHYVIYAADDETVIGYYAVQSMLHGINPYTTSISRLLFYSNVTSDRITITLSNSIVGAVDYPALYFLASTPFYLAYSGYGLEGIGQLYMHSQAALFFLMFLGALALVMKKDEPFRPNFAAPILFGIMSLSLASTSILLMLALVLLLYSDTGRRHAWAIIGAAASLQELLWPILILFMVYTLNNKGRRQGSREIIGAAAVFLLINGYFILSSPSSYISSVFMTLGNIIPVPSASIGYLISSQYPIEMSAYPVLLAAAAALMVLASLYANDKRIIPILSMIPLLFINHVQPVYYAFLMLLFALVCYTGRGQRRPAGWFRSYIGASRRRTLAAAALAAAIVVSMVVIVAASHAAYESGFDVHIYNQTAHLLQNGTILYHADVSYTGASTQAYLAVMMEYQGQGADYFGMNNQSIIKGSLACGYPCSVNVNRIWLSSGPAYSINASLPSNVTAGTAYLNAVVYNSNHYYLGQTFTASSTAAK